MGPGNERMSKEWGQGIVVHESGGLEVGPVKGR